MIWLIILIVLASLILLAVNYMILSKAMDVDYDDGGELIFCLLFSIIGSVVVVPVFLLIFVLKPTLCGLDTLRDSIVKKSSDWCNNSKEEKREIRGKKKKEKAERDLNIIKGLKKEILTLNSRIADLNKYGREEIIEV